MRIVITGLNGTVGPKVARVFRGQGADVVGWDRSEVPPDDRNAVAKYIERTRPDAICHLAMGSEAWAGVLARYAAANDIPFLFASTAMVFDASPDGPHRPGDRRTAKDDYGRYKIRCEDAVLENHPGAIVARFGWQIDSDAVGNNMLAHLDQQQSRDGNVQASRRWIPACSFMDDTAVSLWALIAGRERGVFHLDSNARDAWTFDRIALAVRRRFGRERWAIEVTESYTHDQRLGGHENRITSLSDRLPLQGLGDRS
ncbi:MAG: hypothetical protein A3G34_15620 [Candidatus Lindowbacteria bacterium RIFCSPLOWO2_12_FULL_62_27]|nr:MAG: hypothetical protein A3I06_05435 [Candidatus Lindowbacteria bacterium RIFCSPLOWO2_02_FULL_62_12]OGH63279.1 MAG: hypothetical protein A3G34_15620 [Candidatus Lindowbacteria bacterium RIFCSPLOWO2_12_FULL_62_27]